MKEAKIWQQALKKEIIHFFIHLVKNNLKKIFRLRFFLDINEKI
jgi:hypothetical protein